jgi:hypothetical protein
MRHSLSVDIPISELDLTHLYQWIFGLRFTQCILMVTYESFEGIRCLPLQY